MNQTESFIRWFGDIWYKSNIEYLGKDDPVSVLMENIELKPKRVLEIGCANGWRLKLLKEKYGCETFGVDPSKKAIAAGGGEAENLFVGTADGELAVLGTFDVIIYGFCFAFIDPAVYFKVLTKGDEILEDGGVILLHDRISAFPVKHQYSKVKTKEGPIFSCDLHAMDFSRLWLAHPFYTHINTIRNPDNFDIVCAMRKNIEGAFLRAAYTPKTTINYDSEGNEID